MSKKDASKELITVLIRKRNRTELWKGKCKKNIEANFSC